MQWVNPVINVPAIAAPVAHQRRSIIPPLPIRRPPVRLARTLARDSVIVITDWPVTLFSGVMQMSA